MLFVPGAIPAGRLSPVAGSATSSAAAVAGSTWPTRLADGTVYQTFPSGPAAIPPVAATVGTGTSLTAPPSATWCTTPDAEASVTHTLPSAERVACWGGGSAALRGKGENG